MTDSRAREHASAPRRVRVTFVGFEVFWMQTLVDGLAARFGDTLECRWVLWPSSWGERVRFVFAMMRSDVVVRVGMPFEFESETNRLWLRWIASQRRVKGVNYWIGYDSWRYMKRVAEVGATEMERRAFSALTHVTATENIAEALRASGVPAEAMYFPSPDRPVPSEAPPLPSVFRAILYWRDETWEYSSGPELVAAACRLPGIEFDVLGSTGAAVADPPANLTFHGRVGDMDSVYERAVVLVRMVEWDAVPGAMVEEALLFGRHVIYSFEFPNTVFVAHRDEDGLVSVLDDMLVAHTRGELPLNLAGRERMVAEWQPDARWSAMCERLLRAGRTGP